MDHQEIKLVVTEDGSHSLYLPSLDESFHSFHGAIQESKHVFIAAGFEDRMTTFEGEELHVFEMGFGTGLNAWLTARVALKHQVKVIYTSLEPYPLPESITSQLNYTSLYPEEGCKGLYQRILDATWGAQVTINPYFEIMKDKSFLENVIYRGKSQDLIYFDAFAPSKQPKLWERPVIEEMARLMAPGASFVTYCAKGQLRRDLAAVGLVPEVLPGPPGKKEMTRAKKISPLSVSANRFGD